MAASEAKLLAEKEEQGARALAAAERDLQAHDESVESSGHELRLGLTLTLTLTLIVTVTLTLALTLTVTSTTEASLGALQQRLKAGEQQQEAWKAQEDALVEEERSCRAKHAEGKAAQGNASSRSSQLRALHKAHQP